MGDVYLCVQEKRVRERESADSPLSIPRFHRSAFIGDPFAPGAGIEHGVTKAGMGNGEQIVARGDAGAAIGNDVRRIDPIE